MKIAVGRCWTEDRSVNRNGYVQVCYNGRQPVAHRVAYEILVGPIPEGLELDHLCRNRKCYNPAHLEPVTRSENLRRGDRTRKGFCWGCGVALTDETAVKIRTDRCVDGFVLRCRACSNTRVKAWKAAKRAKQREALRDFSGIPRLSSPDGWDC